jgi:hypothetical protein
MILVGAASCGSSNAEYVAKLRAALDRATLTLSNSIGVAEAEAAPGLGIKAKLLVDVDPVFSVGALAGGSLKDVRVDILTGRVLSVQDSRGAVTPCPGSISLDEAIAIAEAAANGQAVSVQPDDDNRCHREVKVLSGNTLWEVELAADGRVLEVEEDDADSD